MTTLKTTLEDLIKAERALEAALVRTLTNCSAFRTAGNTDAVEVICRERLNLDKAQEMIRASKERLQALAEYQPARDAKIAKHEKAKQRGLWQRRHRLNVVERAELVELNARYGTYTGPANVTRGTKRELTMQAGLWLHGNVPLGFRAAVRRQAEKATAPEHTITEQDIQDAWLYVADNTPGGGSTMTERACGHP